MEILFWISTLTLVFVYAGYGMILWIANKFNSKVNTTKLQDNELPAVAILIAAYNEEEILDEKLKNTFNLDYPKELLKVYIVSDGSTDRTNEIAGNYNSVSLLTQIARKGKTAAINRAMPFIKEPITVFTDANVMLNRDALKELIKHYSDEKTGGVSGEKRVLEKTDAAAAATEGLYWKYESFLKNQDAQLSSLIGAAGELFSIRTHLFKEVPEDTLLDDFMISMNILRQGFRLAYEPKAFATENPSLNTAEELKRKVRIGAGGLQSVLRLTDFLNPFRYGLKSLQYFFHRFSRWIVTPAMIPLALLSNIMIAEEGTIYTILLAAQLLFHSAALVGWMAERKNVRIKFFFVPYYFDFMHYCIIAGWIKYFSGKQQAAWNKAIRLATN